MIGLKRGIVKLSKYSPKWPRLFEQEKNLIAQSFKEGIIDIQHVGSTSIPGMISKPIIDIDVGVKTLVDMDRLRLVFGLIGYGWSKKTSDDHTVMVKGPEKNRTHHGHLIIYNGKIWRNDLLFRDFLRLHEEWAKKYAQLKLELAAMYSNDRQTYTQKKEKFIKKVLHLARKKS